MFYAEEYVQTIRYAGVKYNMTLQAMRLRQEYNIRVISLTKPYPTCHPHGRVLCAVLSINITWPPLW